MSMIAALAAYCFFDNKPQSLQGYCIENTKQLMLFYYYLSRTGVDKGTLKCALEYSYMYRLSTGGHGGDGTEEGRKASVSQSI